MIRKIFFLICYFLLFRYYSHLEKGIVHHLKKTRFLSFRYDLFQVRSVWLGASSRKQHPKWLICFNRLSSYLRKGRNLSWLYEHTVYAWSCEQAWARWMKLALWLLSERDIFFKKNVSVFNVLSLCRYSLPLEKCEVLHLKYLHFRYPRMFCFGHVAL